MRLLLTLFITLSIFEVVGCSSISQGSGTLSGHVDIGPLQPVIREGEPEPTPAPEVYAAWKIVVFSEDGRREITRIDISTAGDYQILLPAGTYLVTTKESRNGGGLGPQQEYFVEIVEGRTTQLDVKIDTGIR